MPSLSIATLLVSLLATAPLAAAYVNAYTVCPNAFFNGTVLPNGVAGPLKLGDVLTKDEKESLFRYSVAKCDGLGAGCVGADALVARNPTFGGVFAEENYGNVSALGVGLFTRDSPESANSTIDFLRLALRSSAKAAFIAQGTVLPQDCYDCYSNKFGGCCRDPLAFSCDPNGCPTSQLVSSGFCVATCPTASYTDLDNGVCLPCSTFDIHAATCSGIALLTCAKGYKIGETGTITPTSSYDSTKTCPAPQPLNLQPLTPDCVCNDDYATSCDESGSITCVAGFAPVNNPDCSGSGSPTFVCAPCGGYFSASSTLTQANPRPAGTELNCVICPALATRDASTRTSTCTCDYSNEFYADTYNKCFYDGAPPTNGMNGKDGMDGAQGQMGTNGTAGPNGKDGANGTTGPAGAAGKNGKNGRNGAAGARGPPGRQGKPGRKGKDAHVVVVVEPSQKHHHKHHEKPERHHESHGKFSHGKGKHHRA